MRSAKGGRTICQRYETTCAPALRYFWIVSDAHPPELLITGDGSHTIRRGAGPTYHSLHGALTESRHIYQEAGLRALLEFRSQNPKAAVDGGEKVRILEIGLGTGLNAALALETCLEAPLLRIDYTALEPFAIPLGCLADLNYDSYLRVGAWRVWAERYPALYEEWRSQGQGSWSLESHGVGYKLRVMAQPWPCPLEGPFDLVFWDAFGPSHAPDLWEEESLVAMDRCTAPGAWLVTFGASGAFGRLLKGLGWEVQRLTGPPGKREIIRARKP
jgi:tRNA U34 5-methylaminomethyl-2-thiouridine-forming methyltransferase MnmC